MQNWRTLGPEAKREEREKNKVNFWQLVLCSAHMPLGPILFLVVGVDLDVVWFANLGQVSAQADSPFFLGGWED
jgi:hypothetical protein